MLVGQTWQVFRCTPLHGLIPTQNALVRNTTELEAALNGGPASSAAVAGGAGAGKVKVDVHIVDNGA